MRRVVALSVVMIAVLAVIAAFIGYRAFGEKDSCVYFARDLELAVTQPTKAPDPDDRGRLTYGTCSTIATKKFDLEFFGLERHSNRTIAGRIATRPGGARKQLRAIREAVEEDRDAEVTPLPELGPDAFLVTRTRPLSDGELEFGGLPDPAAALQLPATAHWVGGEGVSYSASATAKGATVEQSERATARLAVLVSRRPIESAF